MNSTQGTDWPAPKEQTQPKSLRLTLVKIVEWMLAGVVSFLISNICYYAFGWWLVAVIPLGIASMFALHRLLVCWTT